MNIQASIHVGELWSLGRAAALIGAYSAWGGGGVLIAAAIFAVLILMKIAMLNAATVQLHEGTDRLRRDEK